MGTPRDDRQYLETLMISANGVLSADSKGRMHFEEPCNIRTCFQRDVDKITHSKAFRRLKHKTQVFLRPEGDHYRTRLTHTLEVSRIARTIARALRVNEDLTEAIALGHDLGHTPFGHAGERALNEIYSMGFRHYEQSLRVVDHIAKYGKGLNLCFETRMGILNHTKGSPKDTLEAQIVRISDKVAYINHDLDDAIRAAIIKTEDLPHVVLNTIGSRHSIRINTIVEDIITNTKGRTLTMSDDIRRALEVFTDFMFSAVYRNPKAKSEESKVADVLWGIWKYYVSHPHRLPEMYRSIAQRESLERAVCDYVSGMTDKYAVFKYGELYIPAAWQVR